MRYITPVEQDNQLTITFDPVVVAEQNEVRKNSFVVGRQGRDRLVDQCVTFR